MQAKRRFGPFAALLLTTIVGVAALPDARAQDVDRVLLPGHVLPVLTDRALTLPVAKAADANARTIALTIVLRRNDEANFERLLATLYDPTSPEFRRWRTAQQLADRFGPSTADYETVETWFRQQGFAVIERSTNRMTLTVAASRATIEKALEVTIADYKIHEKTGERTFHANRDAPSLPPEIGVRVQAINGLSSFAQQRPASSAINYAWAHVACYLEGLNAGYNAYAAYATTKIGPKAACEAAVLACTTRMGLDAAASANIKGYTCQGYPATPDPPIQGVAVPWKDVNGAGQKIGITAFDTFDPSDVADFLELWGMNPAMLGNVSRVPVNGGANAGPDQSEVLLDIDTVLVGAPGAQIAVYDAPFGVGSFQALFNRMITDQVSIITNSWAYCENQTSASDALSIDGVLATAAAAGITVLTAAGDSGSTCLNGSPNTIVVPAGSPRITAVGGTSLTPGPDATWKSETWWGATLSAQPTGQGGFGASRFFARPIYQNGFTSSAMRSIPDVAFHSDRNLGVLICQAAAGGARPSCSTVGPAMRLPRGQRASRS